jgi:hypothetical protein
MHGFSHAVCSFLFVLGSAATVRAAAPTGTESAADHTTDTTTDSANREVTRVIDIEVDVDDLPDSRANIAETFHAELQRLLSEQQPLAAGVVVAEDRRLLVELRPGPIPGADDVLIRVEAQLDGVVLGETATENCLSCSDEQVAQKTLPMLGPLLEAFPAPAKLVTPNRSASERSAGADALPDAGAQSNMPPSLLPIMGGSLLGVGIVGLGVGIGLSVSDERIVSEPGAAQLELIEYRPAGIALVVGGGIAAVTGAALLGLALRGRTRDKLSAGPVLTPSSYGVALSGQF